MFQPENLPRFDIELKRVQVGMVCLAADADVVFHFASTVQQFHF